MPFRNHRILVCLFYLKFRWSIIRIENVPSPINVAASYNSLQLTNIAYNTQKIYSGTLLIISGRSLNFVPSMHCSYKYCTGPLFNTRDRDKDEKHTSDLTWMPICMEACRNVPWPWIPLTSLINTAFKYQHSLNANPSREIPGPCHAARRAITIFPGMPTKGIIMLYISYGFLLSKSHDITHNRLIMRHTHTHT